jgi:hypothetical protein
MALVVAPLVGCYAQIEEPSLTLTHTLCASGDCLPGGGAPLSLIQIGGSNTIPVNFGDQPLLKPSTAIGPATLNTTLLLNGAAFDMVTTGSGADFSGVQSVTVLAVNPGVSTAGDPCATASNCTAIASFTQPAGQMPPGRHLSLQSTGVDLINFIDSNHTLTLELQATGSAPNAPAWNAQVSMDIALTSRANLP